NESSSGSKRRLLRERRLARLGETGRDVRHSSNDHCGSPPQPVARAYANLGEMLADLEPRAAGALTPCAQRSQSGWVRDRPGGAVADAGGSGSARLGACLGIADFTGARKASQIQDLHEQNLPRLEPGSGSPSAAVGA